MLKIFFDNTLINDDYYTELSTKYTLFDKSFYLGSTSANSFSITLIESAISTDPEVVRIYDDLNLIATLQVDNKEENDDGTITYTLIDAMVNLDGFKYNAQPLIEEVGAPTAMQVLEDICEQAGITLATQSFVNDDILITWYDNRITAREYVSYIAEIAGGYARINSNGQLEIVPFTNTSSETIEITDTSGYKIGEHYKITKVVYDNEAGIHFEHGDETGNTLYLNQNNVYITTQEIVDNIYNSIKDFEFYNITIDDCEIDIDNQVGSIITFTKDNENYPTILGRELTYNGTWLGGYNLQLDTEKQSETNISGSPDFYKNVEARLNRDENMIEFLAEQIQEVSNEITGGNLLNYTDAAKGSIYQLRITGNGSLPIVRPDNDPLEPITNKFKVRSNYYIEVVKNNEIIQHLDLPFETLRYMNSNVKDSFEIINDIGTYTKKVGIDYNGEYYELATPIVITYENMTIESPGGDFSLRFVADQRLSLYSKYLLKNDYTDVFATKVELKSGLKITEREAKLYVDAEIEDLDEEVHGELDLKLGKSETGELISMLNAAADEITLAGGSKINLTTPGKLLINSGNFTLDEYGNIKCTGHDSYISSWRIDDRKGIYTGSGGGQAGLGIYGKAHAFWAGGEDPGTAPFHVGHGGDVVCTDLKMMGSSTIDLTSPDNRTPVIKVSSNNGAYLNDITSRGIGLEGSDGWAKAYLFAENNGGSFFIGESEASSNNHIYGYASSSNNYFRIQNNSSSYCYYRADGQHPSSDRRCKDNITEIDPELSLDIITNLNPVTFNYKELTDTHRGLIAQEVKEVLNKKGIKDQVYEYEKDKKRYSLNYVELIPDLINCIKIQQKQIEELKDKLKESDK